MKVLLTGASSFTGAWFACALAEAGHEVAVVLRREPGGYDGVRGERARIAAEHAAAVHVCSVGDPAFLAVAAEGWDALCHHAAEVADYKSPDFDALAAVAANTRGARETLASVGAVVLTGSVFEPDEGDGGGEPREAFSPYGLSKALTAEVFRFECGRAGVPLGKFTIPNPFGPLEEPRFTSYLVREWVAGRTPSVATPHYVRDNVHVSLLALAYVRFVEETAAAGGFARLNPSGYRETQGEFARRFAAELEPRLGVPCPLELVESHPFDEPRVRVNTDTLDADALGWDESAAWDELAAWYGAAVAAR